MTLSWLHTLYTFLLSMIPVLELRASIPLAYFYWDLPIWWAAIVSILGNIAIAGFILWFFPKVILFVDKRLVMVRTFFQWVFTYTETLLSKKWVRLGEALLIIFVALPFPLTGAWSGCILAYVFGIKTKTAFALISLGIVFAAILVSLLTLGIDFLIKAFA